MKRLLLAILWLYRYTISPLLPAACRHTPTCSEYAIEAVTAYGAWYGALLALKRLSRCHPFARGGYDPLPARHLPVRWFRD